MNCRPLIAFSALILAVVAVGCGDAVDAEGTYTLSVTNRDNGCNFQNWQVGESASNIRVAINQQGEDANADVMDGTRAVLDLLLGDHVFNGTVDRDELDLVLLGTRSMAQGNCTLTLDARMLARLDGDVLTGSLNYSYHGNGNGDCAPYEGCISYQDMNGTRPPQ